MSEPTLNRIKKKQEKVGKLVYEEQDDVTDAGLTPKLREIRSLTSPTSIKCDFEW